MTRHECEAPRCDVVAEDEMVQGALGAWYCIPHWKDLLPSAPEFADELAEAILDSRVRRALGIDAVFLEGASVLLRVPLRTYRLRVSVARPRRKLPATNETGQ
jgi:hypothetical protein